MNALVMTRSGRKTVSLCENIKRWDPTCAPRDILVVGCGDGREAAILADHFGANVVGIDLADNFDAAAREKVALRVMDATKMDFADASFDLVYSFHALEHIPDDAAALREMARVLRPAGIACIGTPNRARLLGYFGSDTTLLKKIRWNAADILMRLRGRFHNKYGAHAGYTSTELLDRLTKNSFCEPLDTTYMYYLSLYSGKKLLIKALLAAKLHKFLFPCVYFLVRKSPTTG